MDIAARLLETVSSVTGTHVTALEETTPCQIVIPNHAEKRIEHEATLALSLRFYPADCYTMLGSGNRRYVVNIASGDMLVLVSGPKSELYIFVAPPWGL